MIEPCNRNSLVGGALGEFCPTCDHCIGVHDSKGLCAACITRDILVARVLPGDTIVIRSEKPLRNEMVARMLAVAKDTWPDTKVVVLSGPDVEIQIVRPGDEDTLP